MNKIINQLLLLVILISSVYSNEIIEKRDFFSKTFVLDDGMYRIRVFSSPIHFLQVNEFVEIDYESLD